MSFILPFLAVMIIFIIIELKKEKKSPSKKEVVIDTSSYNQNKVAKEDFKTSFKKESFPTSKKFLKEKKPVKKRDEKSAAKVADDQEIDEYLIHTSSSDLDNTYDLFE